MSKGPAPTPPCDDADEAAGGARFRGEGEVFPIELKLCAARGAAPEKQLRRIHHGKTGNPYFCDLRCLEHFFSRGQAVDVHSGSGFSAVPATIVRFRHYRNTSA